MSLTYLSSLNYLNWQQQQANPGFTATVQGPDTFQYSLTPVIEDTGLNTIFAKQDTLAPLVSTTFDLTNLTDLLNQPLTFTRAYMFQIYTSATDLQITPGASNPLQWFFMDISDGILVKANSNFMYNSLYPFTVDASNKNITIFNTSATTSTTYTIAIVGGIGAGTTTTTTTTATTTTSTTTTSTTSTTTTSTTSSTTTSTTSSTTSTTTTSTTSSTTTSPVPGTTTSTTT